MARGYSDEADRLLNYLVSACMRVLWTQTSLDFPRNMAFLMHLKNNIFAVSSLQYTWSGFSKFRSSEH